MWPQTVPTPITVVALAFIVSVVVTRLVVVRGVTPTDRLINLWSGTFLVGVLLREPVIARAITGATPVSLPTLFDMWHWTTVSTWTFGLGMLLVREYGPVRYKRPFRIAMLAAIAIGIGFVLLSLPAQAQNTSIASYGGWRYTVYVGLLSVPPIFVSAYLLRTLVMLRRRTTTPRERNVVGILFAVGILSVMPASSYFLLGALGFSGHGDSIADRMFIVTVNGLASGEPQLLCGAVLVSVLVPSCIRGAVRVRELRRLYPLWRDVTTAVPAVVLTLRWGDRWGAWPAERLERMKIETRDAAEIVARNVCPLPIAVDRLIDRTVVENDQENMRLVAELVVALDCPPESGTMPLPGRSMPRQFDIPDLATLRRLWKTAKSLVREPLPLIPERGWPNQGRSVGS